jgi:hypothetical protein
MSEHVNPTFAGLLNGLTFATIKERTDFRELAGILTKEELLRAEYRFRKRGNEEMANKLVVERLQREVTNG